MRCPTKEGSAVTHLVRSKPPVGIFNFPCAGIDMHFSAVLHDIISTVHCVNSAKYTTRHSGQWSQAFQAEGKPCHLIVPT